MHLNKDEMHNIFEIVDKLEKQFEYAVENACLPDEPDYKSENK